MADDRNLANPNPGEWLQTTILNPITGLPEGVRACYLVDPDGWFRVTRWHGARACRTLVCRTREEAIGAVRGWVER